MGKRRKSKYRRLIAVMTVIVIGGIVFKVLDHYGSSDSPPDYPDYRQIPLEEVINLTEVYENDMDKETERRLFLQTGLGEEGIEAVRNGSSNKKDFFNTLKQYQTQLYKGMGEKQMVNLETGDILVSMSQRLCYYPHGHAAIVTDGDLNQILEARSYRAGSCMCKLSKWSKLSSFVVLRVKDEVVEKWEQQGFENPAKSAGNFAKQNLVGLKYSLLKDIRPLNGTTPEYTQCAHLVWYAYLAIGLDIDENRGLIVQPKDFLKSDMLEIVQVFGISPDKLLKMREE
ncbi:MAG: hypothetical protein IJ274_04025 [Lachnospiraceae bacterium]|nr:hypothetical protein [Lachnospiraceae bacterium]